MAIDINIPSQVKTYANLAGFPATGSLKTIFIAEDTNKTYRWTGSAYVEISSSQAATWGAITGTLSNQTDLQTALDGKVDENTAITGATKTKVTYDSKGLVTSGADATTADIADSINKRYVTDANLTTLANTSGVNTGDQTLSGLGGVPTTRTLTINGTTQDLSADRTFTVSTGITIGTTAITSGTVGRVLFEGAGNVVQESANLFWDNVNGRLGIGTSSPLVKLVTVGANVINPINANGGNHTMQIIDTTAMAIGIGGAIGLGGVFDAIGTQTIFAQISGIKENATNSNFSSALTLSTRVTGANILERMRIASTGNVLINTTTDAGFKLDVNGTARVSGNTTIGGNLIMSGTNNVIGSLNTFIFFQRGAGSGVIFTPANSINAASQNAVNVMDSSFGSVSYAGGTHTFNALSINTVINNSGSYNGIVRGIYYNPTLTSLTGTTHYAFHSTSGAVIINSASPNTSAVLQADSTTQGFLPPRMTTTQKNAIATPATGLMVYDTTLNLISVYNGTIWITL